MLGTQISLYLNPQPLELPPSRLTYAICRCMQVGPLRGYLRIGSDDQVSKKALKKSNLWLKD